MFILFSDGEVFQNNIQEKGASSSATNESIESEKNIDKRSRLEVNLDDLLTDLGLRKKLLIMIQIFGMKLEILSAERTVNLVNTIFHKENLEKITSICA